MGSGQAAGTAATPQAGEEAPKESPLSALPIALKGRQKIIHSENPDVPGVVVTRWNIAKSAFIIPEIFAIWGDLPEEARKGIYKLGTAPTNEEEKTAQALAMMDVAAIAVEHCWKRMLYLIRLSVRECDKETVDLMDMEKAMDLLEAIIEVNPQLIPKLKKKLPMFLKKFGPLFGGNKKNTP